jgi:tetratricopeptide (TPR) repeat protein
MNKTLLNFFAAACLFSGIYALADQTNAPSTPTSLSNTDSMNAFLQIQAQLHETQMMVETNRMQTAAALERSALALNSDIQLMEKAVDYQRRSEAESAEGVERTMLIVGGVGMLMLAAVVAMVSLQLRTATRLIELAMAPGSALNRSESLPVVEANGNGAAALPASARAALEFSNARLLGVIERLEKRIIELEDTVRVPLHEGHSSGNGFGETATERRVSDLIVEGQLFLDTNKADKALQCFDDALDIQPELGDALIKKAAALEKLERMDEALGCYDRAIELGDAATTALLQKGGMLNRLARYDEALQCYERALQTQEKKAMSV